MDEEEVVDKKGLQRLMHPHSDQQTVWI